MYRPGVEQERECLRCGYVEFAWESPKCAQCGWQSFRYLPVPRQDMRVPIRSPWRLIGVVALVLEVFFGAVSLVVDAAPSGRLVPFDRVSQLVPAAFVAIILYPLFFGFAYLVLRLFIVIRNRTA